jgi:hypothetical protein
MAKLCKAIFWLIWTLSWRARIASAYFLYRWTEKYSDKIDIRDIVGEEK